MKLLGVTTKCETKLVRKTWEVVFREGISNASLMSYLHQVPIDAKVISIAEHEEDDSRTVIEFEVVKEDK